MGRRTVAELIASGQNSNSYNNTGIDTISLWVDAFNAGLKDLVEDIGLAGMSTIDYVNGTTTYDLPSDFFEVTKVVDSGQYPIKSYSVKDIGTNYQIVFDDRSSTETLTVSYTRYPALLTVATIQSQKPEVPTIGEDALIDYAISRALRNNNQLGQAMTINQEYESGRKKIRDAKYRAAAGW